MDDISSASRLSEKEVDMNRAHHEVAGRPTQESQGHFLTMPCLSWNLHRPQNVCATNYMFAMAVRRASSVLLGCAWETCLAQKISKDVL